MDAGTGLFHHIDHIPIHVMRIKAVDADGNRLALGGPVDVVQGLDAVLAGLFLFRRGDRIFEVEKNVIGGAGGSLVDHRRV